MSPILHRELMGSVRSPTIWWLRAGAAAVGCLILLWASQRIGGSPTGHGRGIFIILNFAIGLLMGLLAPALTADCLTRERREGTLGLLFLTPLSAHQVVLGKAQHHALRWLAIWLAILPIAVVPLLMGGVSVWDVLIAWAIQKVVGIVGLTAGMLASATARYRHQALGLAYGLTLAAALLITAFGATILAAFPIVELAVNQAFARWNLTLPPLGLGVHQAFAGFSLLLAATGIGLLFLVLAGGLAIQRWRRDEFEPPKEVILPATPGLDLRAHLGEDWEEEMESLEYRVWSDGPGRQLRHRRPLEWLRLRERGRVQTIGWWCALVFLGWVFSVGADSGRPAQFVTVLLVAGMSLRAARGYREESQNSTLELLLCTPLPVRELLLSRVRLVRREFLPAVLIQLILCLWLQQLEGPAAAGYVFHPMLMLALGVVPLIGLWVAPRVRLFPLAVAATFSLALGPPLLAAALSAWGESTWLQQAWLARFGHSLSAATLLLATMVIGAWAWLRVSADFRLGRHQHVIRLSRG